MRSLFDTGPTDPAAQPWGATPSSYGDACLHGDQGDRPFIFLGCPNVSWLGRDDLAEAAWFVSRNRLTRQTPQSWPQARGTYAIDSAAFTQMQKHGHWTWSAARYLDFLRDVQDRVGGDRMAWAAPMDACCEPSIVDHVARLGLLAADLGRAAPRGVVDHLIWTVRNGLELRALARPGDPFIPFVVQGWTLDDYDVCLRLYEMAGVDLTAEPLVAIGSTCRRNRKLIDDLSILAKVAWLGECGITRVHAFGLKGSAVTVCAHRISSADSMAWSYNARKTRIMVPGHEGAHGHCGNCPEAALAWWRRMSARTDTNLAAWRAGAQLAWSTVD